MRLVRKLVTALTLAGLPLSLVTGCAPAISGGAQALPASPGQLLPQSSPLRAAVVEAAKKAAQWVQFGYDAGHSGYNPLEKTIGTKNVSNLQTLWNDSSIIQPGGMVVDKNVAYVDDMGQSNAGLYALNAKTGAQKWYANVNLNGGWGSFTHAVSVVAGNVVVTPCSNGSTSKFLTGMCGVNANSGKILWQTYCTEYQGNLCGGLTNNGTSPALYGKLVYFQSVQGVNEQPDTQALDPKNGKIVWDVPGVYHCPDAGLTDGNPLPISNGLVFAVEGCGTSKGGTEICGFSAQSGSAAWCDAAPSYVQAMIAANGKLFVAESVSSTVSILALDAASGALDWTATLDGSNSSTLAAANGSLFVEDGSAALYALSESTGKQLWSYTSNGNAFHGGVLSVANGVVYADGGGGNNGNYAIDAFSAKNGSLIWSSTSVGNGGAPMTPVILNGTVYAGCYTVCAFTASGKSR